MGRNRKPRKAYRPRPVDLDTPDMVKARVATLTLGQRLELMRPLRKAFEGLRMGTAGWPAWCAVADGMNVAEQLARDGIASDHLHAFTAAQAALQALHARVNERGTWTMRAAEITALDFAVDLHGIQLQFVSKGEMEAAITTVQRRVQQALKGNAPADALVCVGALGGAASVATAAQPQ